MNSRHHIFFNLAIVWSTVLLMFFSPAIGSEPESPACAKPEQEYYELRIYKTASWELQRQMPIIETDNRQTGWRLFNFEVPPTLAISPNGKMYAVGDSRSIVYVYDAADGRRLSKFVGHLGPISALVFSPDSQRLASASADNTALVWDLGLDSQ